MPTCQDVPGCVLPELSCALGQIPIEVEAKAEADAEKKREWKTEMEIA